MKLEIVHWESDGKLLCGASLDVDDDRFLLDPRWVKHVTCQACIAKAADPGRSGK